MALQWLTNALLRAIATEGASDWYHAVRRTHVSLAALPSIAAVLRVLAERDAVGAPERDVLLRALLAEHQRQQTHTSAAMLLMAFLPMLRALRGRIRGRALDSEDLDQLVVLSFLEHVLRVPIEARVPVYYWLRRRTTQRVFRTLRAVQSEARSQEPLEGEEVPAVPASTEQRDARDLLRALRDVAPEVQEIVLATVFEHETLRNYVRRVHGALPEQERERLYNALKKRRAEALAVLRKSGVSISSPDTERRGALSALKPPRLGGTR